MLLALVDALVAEHQAARRRDVALKQALASRTSKALPHGVPFQVSSIRRRATATSAQIAASWGIKAVPETALIDRQGHIRAYFVNKRDWQSPVAETCLRSVIDE